MSRNVRQELLDTYDRIKSYIKRTPVLRSEYLDLRYGAKFYLKCENLQHTGSFKMRGAASAVFSLSLEERANGLTAHSSGNFAQAVACAAQKAGVPAYIVMPDNAPEIKQKGVKRFGGHITLCEPTLEAREKNCEMIIQEKGAIALHPSNQYEVILGQGTATMELLEEHPDLDAVLVPVGGGGLLAGTALAATEFGPKGIHVIGTEPIEVDDAWRSLQSGQIETNATTHTIADGLRTQLGDVNFPIIQKLVRDIFRVTEEDIQDALVEVMNECKIIIEPSSAVPLAALKNLPSYLKDKKVGIILSGGNVDLPRLRGLI